jgi:hypothetical protein
MKRAWIMGLGLALILVPGLSAAQSYVLKVKVMTANVRSEPDASSSVIKQLPQGTLLESRQKIGDWYEISITDDTGKSLSGFINNSVVDVVGGEKKEIAPPVPVVQPQRATEPPPVVYQAPPPSYSSASAASFGGFKIMGGLTSASMTYKSQPGYEQFDSFKKPISGLGGGIGFEMGSQIGFEIDVLYIRKGIRFQGSDSGYDFDIKMKIDELSVPVMLKIHILKQAGAPDFYLMGGGEAAYVVQAKASYSISGTGVTSQSATEDIKKDLNQLDYGLVFGAGFGLPMGGVKLFVEGRYHMGLAGIQKSSAGYEGIVPSDSIPKTNVLAIFAGLKF